MSTSPSATAPLVSQGDARSPVRRVDAAARPTGSAARHLDSAEQYVGIDMGVDEVRVATILASPASPRAAKPRDPARSSVRHRWVSADQFILPIPRSTAKTPALIDAVVDTVQRRLPRVLEGVRVRTQISLPPTWVHFQPTSPAELAGVIEQCEAMFRASIFQGGMHSRHWVCDSGGNRLMLAATASDASQRVVEAIASTGYEVSGVIPGAIAIHHMAPRLTGISAFHSVLWMEASGCTSVICGRNDAGHIDPSLINCRALRPFNSGQAANETEVRPARGFGYSLPSLTSIHGWLRTMAIELRATAKFCGRAFEFKPETGLPVLIAGAFAEIPGIDQTLASLLGVPVATWALNSHDRPRSVHRFRDRDAVKPALIGRGTDSRYAAAVSMAHVLADKQGTDR